MKLQFVCFIFLFYSCSRNAFVIKKRYSKGFYTAHPSKVNSQQTIFFTAKDPIKTEELTVKVKTTAFDLPMNHINDVSSASYQFPSIRSIHKIARSHNKTPTYLKSSISNSPQQHYSGKNTGNAIVAFLAILLALISIIALAKTFGLIFTLPVCFVIAFTVVSIFFMIRNHLKY